LTGEPHWLGDNHARPPVRTYFPPSLAPPWSLLSRLPHPGSDAAAALGERRRAFPTLASPAVAAMGARRRASPNSQASSAAPAISDASPPLPCLAQIGGRPAPGSLQAGGVPPFPRLAPDRRRPAPTSHRAGGAPLLPPIGPAVLRSYLLSGRWCCAPPLPRDDSRARCREAGHWRQQAGRRPAGCLFFFAI
jgi:hypothetical protein